jgi:two-component system sensor histidine kinase HydH
MDHNRRSNNSRDARNEPDGKASSLHGGADPSPAGGRVVMGVSDEGLFGGLEEMLTVLIHNAANHLGPIKGYASLIHDGNDSPDNTKRWADKIVRNVRRMEDYLELLNLYRIRSAVGVGETTWQNVVAAVMDRFSAVNVKAIPIEIVNDTRGSFVQHVELLKRVLGHLVVNAYESIETTGKLSVTVTELEQCEQRKRRFGVRVTDTGCGIERKNVELAWRPFFTTKPAHVGLGLPFVASAARILAANIKVESRPGYGTTVSLVLSEKGG